MNLLKYFFFTTFFFCFIIAKGQIVNGVDTLYGNEWINPTQTYFKIPIAEDGIYRLSANQIQAIGIPLSISANQFQIFRYGQEIPIFTSSSAVFNNTDFIEFYGRKNRGELDAYIYKTGQKDMLNPEYSNFTDTAIYYLTWQNSTPTKRFNNQTTNIANAPAKANWFWYTIQQVNSQGLTYAQLGGGVAQPSFDAGEGYGSGFTQNFTTTFTPKFKVDNQEAKLDVRYVTSASVHYTTINLNNKLLDQDTVGSYIFKNKTFTLPASEVGTSIPLSISGSFDASDQHSVSIVQLTYARTFNFDNLNYFEFKIKPSQSNAYLEIDNFNAGTTAPILYDITNNLRITTILENGKIKVVLPPSVFERQLVLFATNIVKNAAMRTGRTFTDFKKNTGDYILLTTPRFNEIVQTYANYRASQDGGSFKPIIIDINQIYEQFGYGLQGHPLAVRNFAHFTRKFWQNPKFIVLVGKSKEYYTNRAKSVEELPTFGLPGSDLLLVANNSSDAPIIPIGRISAASPNEVSIYLEKVKDLEATQRLAPYSVQDREWYKNVMHLNGGSAEREYIGSLMSEFTSTLTQSKLGVNVTTFKKESSDVVQYSVSDRIYDRINQGASVVTFFGHSSTSILDFDINNPDFFKNKGKYPLFMAFGCVAGNCFQDLAGISENMIFYPLRGMGTFLGTSGNSYISPLSTFGNTFYTNMATKNIGKSIGEIVQASVADLNSINDETLHAVLQELILNGDPAIKLHTTLGVDITPDVKTFKIEPAILDAQLDSFSVSFDIVNIGITTKDSMVLSIKRQFPNGAQEEVFRKKMLPPQYRTPFKASFPMNRELAVGENRLFVTVDADNTIAELPAPFAENNNTLVSSNGSAGMPFYVLENTVKPIYPTEFAIVAKTPIVLKSSSTNALAKSQPYIIEIDTVENFNSPLKQRTNILQRGGVIKWQPNIVWKDSTVYYWRIAMDSASSVGYNWQNSSFIYLPKATGGGWNQSKYAQIKQNSLDKLKLNEYNQTVEFGDIFTDIEFKPNLPSPTRHPFFTVNGDIGSYYWGSPSGGIQVIVFDSVTNRMWRNMSNTSLENPALDWYKYGFPQPSGFNVASFIFDLNDSSETIGRRAFMNFIENRVPRNNYVMVYTGQSNAQASYNPQNWAKDSISFGKNIFQVLEKQGAIRIRETLTKGSVPYLFVYQKDRNNVIRERITTAYEDVIKENFTLTGRGRSGIMTSKIVGPAEKWQNLELKYLLSAFDPQNDTVSCTIVGIGTDKKTETTLLSNIKADNTTLSDINAAQYPYLKLIFNTKDSLSRTSAQLKYWRIYYKGLPDFAVNPNVYYQFQKDTMQVGETFKMGVSVENINEYISKDSALIQMTVTDETNKEILQAQKIPPLSIDSSKIVNFSLNTQSLAGAYRTFFEVNPKGIVPELYGFNNYIQNRFYVEKDNQNPLLDVTFDGIRIMNNDIVSAKPNITITLRDENTILALTDTALFKLAVEYPDNSRKTLFFNDPTLFFSPAKLDASGKNNKATIEYRPTFAKDGIYRLIVQARDVAGNNSGSGDYSIGFKVITKAQISNVLPYPNPSKYKL
jgi:Peptidase family C25